MGLRKCKQSASGTSHSLPIFGSNLPGTETGGRDLEKEGEFMFYNFPPDYDEAGHQGTIIWSVLSCWLLGSSADMLELLGMVGMIFSAEFSVA